MRAGLDAAIEAGIDIILLARISGWIYAGAWRGAMGIPSEAGRGSVDRGGCRIRPALARVQHPFQTEIQHLARMQHPFQTGIRPPARMSSSHSQDRSMMARPVRRSAEVPLRSAVAWTTARKTLTRVWRCPAKQRPMQSQRNIRSALSIVARCLARCHAVHSFRT